MANKSRLNILLKKLKNIVENNKVFALMWESELILEDYFKDDVAFDLFVNWLNNKNNQGIVSGKTAFVFIDKEIIERNIESFKKQQKDVCTTNK